MTINEPDRDVKSPYDMAATTLGIFAKNMQHMAPDTLPGAVERFLKRFKLNIDEGYILQGDVNHAIVVGARRNGSESALRDVCKILNIPVPTIERAAARPPEPPISAYAELQQKAEPAQPERRILIPRPFAFPDAKSIPPRSFIMGSHFIRKYVSATIAPAGLGKSALLTTEILALVSGKRLLGNAPRTPKRVWCIGEDDQVELERRFTAAMKFHGIKAEDCGGRLFAQSFRDTPLAFAEQGKGGLEFGVADVNAVVDAIREMGIDVIVLDPLVKVHRVSENDNGAMEAVFSALTHIAEQGNCAVELIIHSRKGSVGQAKSIEDARGASSQLGALRDARLVIRMTDEEAQTMGIDPKHAAQHIRIGDSKTNMTPMPDLVQWFKLESVSLDNAIDDDEADNHKADNIQVVAEFKLPALFEGIPKQDIDMAMRAINDGDYRQSPQAHDWGGHIIGTVLGLDTRGDKGVKKRVGKMIDAWVKSGALAVEMRRDRAKREDKPFLAVGNWTFTTRNTEMDFT